MAHGNGISLLFIRWCTEHVSHAQVFPHVKHHMTDIQRNARLL